MALGRISSESLVPLSHLMQSLPSNSRMFSLYSAATGRLQTSGFIGGSNASIRIYRVRDPGRYGKRWES